jgi:hypothetical protein
MALYAIGGKRERATSATGGAQSTASRLTKKTETKFEPPTRSGADFLMQGLSMANTAKQGYGMLSDGAGWVMDQFGAPSAANMQPVQTSTTGGEQATGPVTSGLPGPWDEATGEVAKHAWNPEWGSFSDDLLSSTSALPTDAAQDAASSAATDITTQTPKILSSGAIAQGIGGLAGGLGGRALGQAIGGKTGGDVGGVVGGAAGAYLGGLAMSSLGTAAAGAATGAAAGATAGSVVPGLGTLVGAGIGALTSFFF